MRFKAVRTLSRFCGLPITGSGLEVGFGERCRYGHYDTILGEPKIPSPLKTGHVDDSERVLYELSPDEVEKQVQSGNKPVSFMKAGPRERLFFDPSKLKAAIVTTGGLCPGLNNVIRSLFLTLYHTYGVRNVFGIKYGFQGFIPSYRSCRDGTQTRRRGQHP